jgi:hypothetical protein
MYIPSEHGKNAAYTYILRMLWNELLKKLQLIALKRNFCKADWQDTPPNETLAKGNSEKRVTDP